MTAVSRCNGRAYNVHSRVFTTVEPASPLAALSVAGARVEVAAEVEAPVLDALLDVVYALAHRREAGADNSTVVVVRSSAQSRPVAWSW